jgi:EcsC protein family
MPEKIYIGGSLRRINFADISVFCRPSFHHGELVPFAINDGLRENSTTLEEAPADTFTSSTTSNEDMAMGIEEIGQLIHQSARAGLRRAYEQVQIDPEEYLETARAKYGLPIQKWEDIHALDHTAVTPAAEHIVASSSRTAALEGAGLGLGGFLGTVPDLGILAAITMRMLQKLSLIHGFEYSTGEELAGLWLAAASAAGIDCGREFLEKQAAEKLVPQLMEKVACKMGSEFAEKWVGLLVPMISAGVAGTINYYFVRSWGRRAHRHFAERHRVFARLGPDAPLTIASPDFAV